MIRRAADVVRGALGLLWTAIRWTADDATERHRRSMAEAEQ